MQNLKDTIKTAADEKMAAFDAVRELQEKSRILDEAGAFDPTIVNTRVQVPEGVGPGIQRFGDVARAYGSVMKDRDRDVLAIQKLNAELSLTNLTISEAEKLMDSTFSTISGTGSATAGVKTGDGAPKAAKAVSEVNTEAGKLSQAATQMQSSFGAAFVDMVTGAKSAQDAVASLLQDLAKMLANQAFQSLLGAGGSGIFAGIGKVLGFASGGALNGGRVQAFAAGGIVNGPTVFPMANGAGLMGEAGPEAIMPLTRIGGKLGVRAAGGGGSVVNIDARYATEGTAEMIVKAIQRAAPGIVKQSVSANRAAGARGYR
jgi:hypothetical protein